MRLTKSKLIIVGLSAGLLVQQGCRKAEVRVYDVAKEEVPSPALSTPSMPSGAASAEVAWDKPDAWEALAPTQIRKGNYRFVDEDAGSAEITVTSFPGSTGSLLANVNRWLGQAGLPPVSESELMSYVSQTTVGPSIPCFIVDLKPSDAAENSTRIYAATFQAGGNSWFFKMSGPSAVVETQTEAFDSMIESVRISGAAPATAASQSDGHTHDLIFDSPEGWTASEGSSMRIASFQIEKEGLPPADFSITSFPGDTGGVAANVNRWRRQIGLSPWSPDTVEERGVPITAESGLELVMFDLKPETEEERSTGDERILAAILPHHGSTWFFKLRGDTLLLDTQKNKFEALLYSVAFRSE